MGTCQCLKWLAFCEKFGQSPLKICQPPAPVCKTAPVDQPAAPLVKIFTKTCRSAKTRLSCPYYMVIMEERE